MRKPKKGKMPPALARYWRTHKRGNPGNPRGRSRISSRVQRNPPGGREMIYPEIIAILARKDPREPHRCDARCKRAGHLFEHQFKKGSAIYGTADGSKIIIERRRK